ncbi:MAG: GcrA family cell cycle regulator [bacterium]
MAWTDDRVEQLKQLWAEGLSASQIANKMGGVTRNAVIGKVHRLGLSGRATPAKPQLTRKKTATRPTTQKLGLRETRLRPIINEPEFLEPLVLDSGDKATVSTLNKNMCRWPVGDPSSENFHFCGQASAAGKPYCAYHAHMAFQPSSSSKREARKDTAKVIAAPKRAAG